jgi:hypothetical protein
VSDPEAINREAISRFSDRLSEERNALICERDVLQKRIRSHEEFVETLQAYVCAPPDVEDESDFDVPRALVSYGVLSDRMQFHWHGIVTRRMRAVKP